MLADFGQSRFRIFLLVAAVIITAAVVAILLTWESSDNTTFDEWAVTPPGEQLVARVETNLTPDQRAKFTAAVEREQDLIARGDSEGERTMLRPYLHLGINYESLGELELARQAYLGAAAANTYSDIPWSNLGSLYQAMGSPTLAERALRRAIQLNQRNALVWQKLIELSFVLRYSDSQIKELYIQALTATDNNSELVRDHARFLEQGGDIDGAIAQWQSLSNNKDLSAADIKAEIERLQRIKK